MRMGASAGCCRGTGVPWEGAERELDMKKTLSVTLLS